MDISILQKSILFKGFDDTEIADLLKALNAVEKKFKKGTMIFSSGDHRQAVLCHKRQRYH